MNVKTYTKNKIDSLNSDQLSLPGEFSTDKKDYNIVDERRLWVHKDVNMDDIYRSSNSLYIYTKPTDYTKKGIIKIGETGSLTGDRPVKDRIYEQPNSTDTEPLLLLFVLDCKSYVDNGVILNAKELEGSIHSYLKNKQWVDGAGTEWFKVSVADVIKLIKVKVKDEKIALKQFTPHFLQEVVIRQVIDNLNKGESINIVAELCARFGKTLTFIELFNRMETDVMIVPSYMHSVFSSIEGEIVGNYKDETIGKWSNFYGFKIINTIEDSNWKEKFNSNLGKNKMIVFVSIQSESLEKFDIIRSVDGKRKFILIDEADFGASTANSNKVISYMNSDGDIPYGLKIVTSGTGISKASKIFMDQIINDVVSISYTEMLLTKNGESKYFLDEYRDELVGNVNLLSYLKSIDKESCKKTLNYIPDVNFWKLSFPERHKDLIHSEIDEDDLTGWGKILSDVAKNSSMLKATINGLWGKAGIKLDILNTLAISNVIGKEPRVVQFFVGCPNNDQLDKLSIIFRSCLPNYIIRVLSGGNDAKNATSESIVKDDIKKCKEDGKDGVIILSMNMGSRSFSISETDAVVLMFDNGSVSSLIQKISRALTGGLDYDGNEKKVGNIISLSLDPNRVDSVDVFVIEESQKNKTKSESMGSVVRRIRRSINIFEIDENGDKVNLLVGDDYYTELIEKFNFDKLKNSQIDLLPLISDKELRDAILCIKNSDTKKTEDKEKQLKGKGKKFLDKGKGNNSDEGDEEKFTKADIEILRRCVVTINNSILSIAGIDDSVFGKKSFRKTLSSIDSDLGKTDELKDLLGVPPKIVIELLDKEVINENTIDICLSRF